MAERSGTIRGIRGGEECPSDSSDARLELALDRLAEAISRRGKSDMKVTAFEGVVDEGLIRLQPPIRLPDKTRVYVVVPELELPRTFRGPSPRLANPEEAADFRKQVIEVLSDDGV